jgi:isopentenyl-diphosphate delta-isomerase
MSTKVLAKMNDTADFKLVDKLLAHQKGWQHYAFSIFIFNDKNELLVQKRAAHKYHSPSLWTNTCCSHPLSKQISEIKNAATKRLQEEMGFTTALDFLFQFKYKVQCNNQLIENEIDFVFSGRSNEVPIINSAEVSEYKWINMNDLILDVAKNPEHYTEWLKLILEYYAENFEVKKKEHNSASYGKQYPRN